MPLLRQSAWLGAGPACPPCFVWARAPLQKGGSWMQLTPGVGLWRKNGACSEAGGVGVLGPAVSAQRGSGHKAASVGPRQGPAKLRF